MVYVTLGPAVNLTEWVEVLKAVSHGAVDHVRNTKVHNFESDPAEVRCHAPLEVLEVPWMPRENNRDFGLNGYCHCCDELTCHVELVEVPSYDPC